MKYNKHKNSTDYVVAPEIKGRKTVMNMLSRSFTHFWKLTGSEEEFTLKHLRKTYVTTIYSSVGDDASKVTGQSVDTIIKSYLDKEMILAAAQNFDLRTLNDALVNKGRKKSA